MSAKIFLATALVVLSVMAVVNGQGAVVDKDRSKYAHLARVTCNSLYDACYSFGSGIASDESAKIENIGACSLYEEDDCVYPVTKLYECLANCSSVLCPAPARVEYEIEEEEEEEEEASARLDFGGEAGFKPSKPTRGKPPKKNPPANATQNKTKTTTTKTTTRRKVVKRNNGKRLLQAATSSIYTSPDHINFYQANCLSQCKCGAAATNATTTAAKSRLVSAVKALHGLE